MDMVWFAIWVFLPAGLANASPVVANKLPLIRDFTTPLDFGKHYRGKRIFGDNKTWRGLLFGTLVGGLTAFVQALVVTPEYEVAPLLFGSLLGFGALAGDAAESLLKRQKGIPSGESWFPFDQLDYIIGALALASLVLPFSLAQYLAITLVWLALHLLSVYVGFLLGVRDKPI